MKTVPLPLLWYYNAVELANVWTVDEARCREYAALTTPFPAVVLAETRAGFQIADGRHRVIAATLRGDKEIAVRSALRQHC